MLELHAKYRTGLRLLNNIPTIFINDQPIHGLMPYAKEQVSRLDTDLHAGIHLVHITDQFVDDTGVVTEPTERLIEQVLTRDPAAFIALRSLPAAPACWYREHPDDLQGFEDGVVEKGLITFRMASYGSYSWRDTVATAYEDFARRIHKLYDGRVIMQHFGAGICMEWGPEGAPDLYGRWWLEDLSPAMHEHFRQWLRQRYQENVSALREAWSDSHVTFETAGVPGREERLVTDWFTFRDPRKRKVADYYEAYTDAIADCIIAFCEAIKRGTNGEVLAGSHSGGFLDNGFHAFIYHQIIGCNFRRVVRHPAVDIFTTPISYLNRQPGGSPNAMAPTGSLRLHGKWRMQDQDSRTCLSAQREVVGNDFLNVFGVPKSLDESVAVLKRDVGRVIVGGYGQFWHDLPSGNHDHPVILDCTERLTEMARLALHLERGFLPDMAVMADERAGRYQQCANRLFYPLLYAQRVEVFCHAGLSWDVFEMADFFEPNFPSSPLVLMLNPFFLTDDEITAIRSTLAGSGRTVVWFVAPGVQSPKGFDLEAVRRLTGFHIRTVEAEANPRISLTNYTHPITRGLGSLQQPHSFGTGVLGTDERDSIFGPIIYLDEPDAEVLGTLDSLYRPGLAVKEMDGWTSVYSCAPRLSRPLLRNLARYAGVHNYLDSEDMITVSPELLLIHGTGAGQRTLHFPTPRDVVDLWTGEMLARAVIDCPVELTACDTRILFHGDIARYEAARKQVAKTRRPF